MAENAANKLDLWSEFEAAEHEPEKPKLKPDQPKGSEWTGQFDRRSAPRDNNSPGEDQA